jgi:Ulp1 family protease
MNPGLHWIAFKVDFHKQYIATMCSLKNTLNTEAKKLKDCISSIVPAARSFQHISVTVPFQKNHVDCGPLCCMFMLFLAQNDISADTCLEYDTLPAAAAMRLRIFSDIAAKKLTILVPTC